MKIDRICSIQGSAKENEDSVDYKNQYFWIIDGATDLFNAKDSIGYSVSEVSHLISECLKKYCDDSLSLKKIFELALDDVRTRIEIDKCEFDDYYQLPTFAFIFAKLSDIKLEYIMIGDCVMIVNNQTITDHRVDCLFEQGKFAIKSNHEVDKKTILQNIRKLANKPEGYWIGSLDKSSINHVINGSLEVTSNHIVLMTDGFYDFYTQNSGYNFGELIEMRKESTNIDPIYGKKDDASILIIDV